MRPLVLLPRPRPGASGRASAARDVRHATHRFSCQTLWPGAPNGIYLDAGKSTDGDGVAFYQRLFNASRHLLAVERTTVGVVEQAYDVGARRLPDDQQVPAGDTVVAVQSDGLRHGTGASAN